MILTGDQISKQVKKGSIILDPFQESLINPNSYNYRLGSTLLKLTNQVVDAKGGHQIKKIKISKKGYVLKPNTLYLGSTLESIGSNYFVPSLIGRSSIGRLGLFLQITADLGHIGTNHHWTLELKVVQPLRVYPEMKIGQVSFWKPTGLELLDGKKYSQKQNSYANYSKPQTSIPSKLK